MRCGTVRAFRFWVKTALYRFFFNSFGYYRRLKTFRNSNYNHSLQKHPVRGKHFGKGGWKERWENGFLYRDYANYEEYLIHQKVKLDEMLAVKGGFDMVDIVKYRIKFFNRFYGLVDLLPQNARILCLGARQGTEVEVLRDLGFVNAYGIDLNPGPDNPWVRKGDFMAIDEPDNSIDLVYTNAVDHAFDLDAFFKEHSRVVKKDGYAIYDLNNQSSGSGAGAFEAVEWESEERVFLLMLKCFQHVIHVETEKEWKWVLLKDPRGTAQATVHTKCS